MSRVEIKQVSFKCAGCGATFDDAKDVCTIPHTIGTQQVGVLCPRCHVTALGSPPPHAFRDPDLL